MSAKYFHIGFAMENINAGDIVELDFKSGRVRKCRAKKMNGRGRMARHLSPKEADVGSSPTVHAKTKEQYK